MNCELISVGTELLLGDILNTNARFLSQELALCGVDITYQCTVGDNRQRLLSALDSSFSRCDTVILTGGLGPTPDDLTKEVCAEYFGAELELDKNTESEIKEYFAHRNREMPESNLKQALVPKNAVVLQNRNGTAPGLIMEKDGKRIIILPGPPSEMEPMFNLYIKPFFKKLSESIIKSHTVRTFGIGESAMSEKVKDLLEGKNPTVAPYAKSGEALLRITAKAKTEAEADELAADVLEEIKARIGEYIYGIDVSSTEEALCKLLKEKNLTVAFAESCTAGFAAKRLTDIAGASQVFHCGVVTYSNDIKEKFLDVKKETLEKYGAVSAQTAQEMALGIKNKSGSHIGVGITGEAGPTSGDGKPVGLIYIAVTDGKKTAVKEFRGRSQGNCRDYNRFAATSCAFNSVIKFIDLIKE